MGRGPIAMPLLEGAPEPAEPAQQRFLNRELSCIDFDRRVLELAADPELPLLERVRYCGIASSNLDEFFAVRMPELYDYVDAGITRKAADGWTPAQTVAQARRAIDALQAAQDQLWHEELQPALARERIRISKPSVCRPRALRAVRKRVERDGRPVR